jgi:phospholipase/lecithinase/hemolysin
MKKQVLLTAGVLVATGWFPSKALAASFSGLYVFGDSLSDTGNVSAFTGGVFPPFPYVDGRFSNGDTWIDYLADDLGLTPTPVVSVLGGAVPTQGINFAFGGATTGQDNTISQALLGLDEQLDLYAQVTGGQADPNALYILWGGANDYLPTQSPDFVPFTRPQTTIANLTGAIDSLFAAGARNFLVANLPDLGQVPLVVNTQQSKDLDRLSQAHNRRLDAKLARLDQKRPGINISTLDVNTLFDTALAGGFGFTTVDAPCFNQFTGTLCSNPDEFLFWDFIHPTTKAHEQIGKLAFNTLNPAPPASTPEPVSVLGMLAFGIWGAGAVQRKRVAQK